MSTENGTPQSTDVRSLLLLYTLNLVAGMVAVQVLITVTGGEITVLVGAGTAAIALGLLIWVWRNRNRLKRVRFGGAIAHAIAYVVVTTSFNAHAAIRGMTLGSEGGIEAAADSLLASPWFGATLIMSSIWGIGLFIHLLGTVLGRGWED